MDLEVSKGKLDRNYIPADSRINWDDYFMLQAMLASYKSKDPSTKVGAVFVDANNHQVTMGYNGFIAGIDESQLPWGNDESAPFEHQKYAYVVHAEANAILHSTGKLEGSRAYVTLFPCDACAKLLASVKVKEVIFLSDKHHEKDSTKVAKKIFEMSGITFRQHGIKKSLLKDLDTHLEKLIP